METDSELANAVNHALASSLLIPASVSAMVSGGSVELSGSVEWSFERDAAERTVRNVSGVLTVQNHIQLQQALHEQAARAP